MKHTEEEKEIKGGKLGRRRRRGEETEKKGKDCF